MVGETQPLAAPAAAAPVAGGVRTARALLECCRPRQALKNLLVLAAPAAAGRLDSGDVRLQVAVAFAAFTLTASGLYLLNDVHDAAADRRHPDKARRPIADGRLGERLARAVAGLLIAAGLAAAATLGPAFLGVVATYVAIVLLYIVWARAVPVLDLAAVASGFYLRAAGGAVAIDVPVSRWFAIVALFGSLFLVAGKRQGERIRFGDLAGETRPTLARYSVQYLREVVLVAAAVTIGAYCLWAFERADVANAALFELTIVPFVVFMLRYLLLVEDGRAEEPEALVLHDPGLRASAALWCVLFGLAVTMA
jgi:decaprenyl-phosphate phosphoribosyltransferase